AQTGNLNGSTLHYQAAINFVNKDPQLSLLFGKNQTTQIFVNSLKVVSRDDIKKDVRIFCNEDEKMAISLKAGSTKQIAQAGGTKAKSIQKLFKILMGLEVPDHVHRTYAKRQKECKKKA